jgi:hypothetical protein
MNYREPENQIPCIIENGIVYGVKDMYRVVRDMGHVHYQEIVNGEVVSANEGYIMSVVANPQSATIIANKRLYLNVCGFDYLRISTLTDGSVTFDLINPHRTLRLAPQADLPPEEGIAGRPDRFEDYAEFEPGDYAEIQLDDDDDIMDGE